MKSNHSLKCTFVALVLAGLLSAPCLAQGGGGAADKAKRYLRDNQPESALVVLTAAIALDSADIALWQLKSEIALESMDTLDAITALQQTLVLRPDHEGVRAQLQRLLFATGQAAAALESTRATSPRARPRSPDALYLWGQIFEANGLADSASRYYKHAFELLTQGDLPLTPLPVGSQISTVELTAPDGDTRSLRPRTATILVFWASWSKLSEIALQEIAEQKKKSAMTWKLIPINLDSAVWQHEAAELIVDRARSLGCKDTVYFDHGWSLARAWAIDRIPCCVTLEYGGTVTGIVHGWDSLASTRILEGALGALSDSVVTEHTAPDTVRGRSLNLRALARREWTTGRTQYAMQHIDLAVRADPSFDLSHADLIAYRWIRGDATGARHALDRFPAGESSSVWPELLAAHIIAAEGGLAEAVDLLADSQVQGRQEVGQFNVSLALLAARDGRFELAEGAYDNSRTLCRFNRTIPEIEARLAEQSDSTQALHLWHQAVDRLLSTQTR